jgi:hypothetical protein
LLPGYGCDTNDGFLVEFDVGSSLMTNRLIQPLLPGSIDILGDIHGEIDALLSLMSVLGYRADGTHPDARRLVFMGDLSDRGPDSPAVFAIVSDLVDRGLAQCLMGNHELNLLRQARKEGNGWYFDSNHDHDKKKFLDSRALKTAQRPAVRAFLEKLPIALERQDLRLVHAAWHLESLAELRSSCAEVLELYDAHHRRALQLGNDTGLADQAEAEERSMGERLTDPDSTVPFMPALAALDALYQDGNPVRIATSGLERVAPRPFFASGKWRFVERHPWWNAYHDEIPVIIGHYWRRPNPAVRQMFSRGEADLFEAFRPNQWFGAKRNVFCVDFAVGARYMERASGITHQFQCRLAAVRWPEKELVMDDATRRPLE